MSNKSWEDLDITKDELDSVATALKTDEFRKAFFQYCEEIQDPENCRKREEELIQLEAERGVEVTFIRPEPGFVVKTSVDGKMKGFINMAFCNKVAKPTSECKHSGENGISWSVPYAQAPPRRDVDKKGATCLVYDVVFHSDALRQAEKNQLLRKYLIDTACDAVEREFKVKLDRANLKFPVMKYKGAPHPTVIRKLKEYRNADDDDDDDTDPLKKFYPPLPTQTVNSPPRVFQTNNSRVKEAYTAPKYVIKQRRDVDYSELTHELDAKINVSIPKELVIEIDLPMLTSTSDCNLDVTTKNIYLCSEKPAKYKINISLPYPVNEDEGSAKFDRSAKKLVVTLPVRKEKELKLKDLYREDSGVESDVREETSSGNASQKTKDSSAKNLIEVISSTTSADQNDLQDKSEIVNFLDDSLLYYFPPNFDCNTIDSSLALTLHVKNVDPESLKLRKSCNYMHIKFFSIGAGLYPTHYAFYIQLPDSSETSIENVQTEVWDNNVIVTLELRNCENLKSYFAGLHENDLKDFQLTEEFIVNAKKFAHLQSTDTDKFRGFVKTSDESEAELQVQQKKEACHNEMNNQKSANLQESSSSKDHKKHGATHGKKHQKKKNKKQRSMSESYCDNLKETIANINSNMKLSKPKSESGEEQSGSSDSKDSSNSSSPSRKIRSSSESRSEDGNSNPSSVTNKGILKRNSRYCRSMSESYSSIDDHMYSLSIDLHRIDSTDDIPEEGSQNSLSESCKKTVRFSDVIRKQLFRMDSSILGQRKKNQKKKNQKQRALQRRNSEGDSVDYIDKDPKPERFTNKNENQNSAQHDSGLDLSTDGNFDESFKIKDYRSEKDECMNAAEMEFKNPLIFDLEI